MDAVFFQVSLVGVVVVAAGAAFLVPRRHGMVFGAVAGIVGGLSVGWGLATEQGRYSTELLKTRQEIAATSADREMEARRARELDTRIKRNEGEIAAEKAALNEAGKRLDALLGRQKDLEDKAAVSVRDLNAMLEAVTRELEKSLRSDPRRDELLGIQRDLSRLKEGQ